MTTKEQLTTAARAKQEQLKRVQAERDAAIRAAVAAGVSLRRLGSAVGLSHQRVAQIAQDAGASAPTR